MPTDTFVVYILQSQRNGRYYIGYAADVHARLDQHNSGLVKATRYLKPWALVYTEQFPDSTSARKREWNLKSMKSRIYLKSLIRSVG